MDLDEILKLSPNTSCVIHHELTETWEGCYYQYKNDSADPNGVIISTFDEKYNECGWGDLGYDHESVFDPTKEVHEESSLDTLMKREYTSDTFIELIQKKIKEFKNEEEGDTLEDFLEWLGILGGHGGVDDLCYEIGCDDYKQTLEKEDDSFLWYSHYELETESQDIWITELIDITSL